MAVYLISIRTQAKVILFSEFQLKKFKVLKVSQHTACYLDVTAGFMLFAKCQYAENIEEFSYLLRGHIIQII